MPPLRFPNEPIESYIARLNADTSALEAAVRAQDRDQRERFERGRDVAMRDRGFMGMEGERGGVGRVERDGREVHERRERVEIHSSQHSDSEKINITSKTSLNIQIPFGANGTIKAIKGISLVRGVEMEVSDADGERGAGQERVETEEYKHEYSFEAEEWWEQRWRHGVM